MACRHRQKLHGGAQCACLGLQLAETSLAWGRRALRLLLRPLRPPTSRGGSRGTQACPHEGLEGTD